MAKRSSGLETALDQVAQKTGAPDDILDSVAEAFSGSPGLVRARCYKILDDGQESHLFDFGPDDVQTIFERIRENYGSGKYQVTTFLKGKYSNRFRFSVLAPPNWKPPAPPKEAVPAIDPGLAAILSRMDERAERSERVMLAMLERIANPLPSSQLPSSPFDLADKMMSTMRSMMETVGQQKQESMFEAVMKGVELRDKLAGTGGEGGGTNFLDVVREGLANLPVIADVVKALPKSQPVPPAQQIERPRPVQVAQLAPDPFAAQIAFLVDRARDNNDPEPYAAMLADVLPKTLCDQLLAQPDPVAVLATAWPGVSTYRGWFSELIDLLRSIVQDADSALPANEGEPFADGTGAEIPPASASGPTGRRTSRAGDAEGDAGRGA